MSSQGGEESCSGAAGNAREQGEEEFYNCHETLEPPCPREEEQEAQQEAAGLEDFHVKTETLNYRRDYTETETGGLEREQQQEQEEEEEEEEQQQQQQQRQDEDSDIKEEDIQVVEFDDDYLREVEKELTEEEKESRRQQSCTLKEKGNCQFKSGDWVEAERSYTEALGLCPVCFSRERAVLFSNRAAAKLHLDLKDQAIADCTRAIELNPDYVRALLRRAELYEQTEKLDEALEDYKKVLDQDPNQTVARQACMRLPQQIQERNEKLKEEMISKLKDLGNMILRPFGLSTNNFQVNQDQDTGSYSINFVQNTSNNNR